MSDKTNIGRDTVPVIKTELVISKTFDLPRETVWKAWTIEEQLSKWWGPKGFPMVTSKMALEKGGFFHYCVRSPAGQEMWGRFVYVEIKAPEKLIFISSFSDKPGGVIRNPMNLSWPLEVLNDFTFSETPGSTILTMKGTPHNATKEEQRTFAENHENIKKGFAGTFEQLDQFLAGYK